MKKLLISLLLLATPFQVWASEGVHGISLDTVLNEILDSQNITLLTDIECEEVTDDQFEKLGEAVMGTMHPDPDQHELMDSMMGGEGSDSLRAAHIHMGQTYLGCGSGGLGMMGSGMGMMGGGMMSGFSNQTTNEDGFSMMGLPFMGSGLSSGWWMFNWGMMLLFWTLVILGIVWLVRAISGRSTDQGKSSRALDIIKTRYAKGEIDKEEFEQMKKRLST